MSSKILEFVPISSSINPSFWNKLSEIKLNEDKLCEVKHNVWGYFTNINNKSGLPILEVNSTSFNRNFDSQRIYIPFHGKILNLNTIEQFKEFDKSREITKIGESIFQCIETGEALETPSCLNQFFVLSFADLKKFNFYYWFAFPVPHNLSITYNSIKTISDSFTSDQLIDLWNKYCGLDHFQKPYFIVYIEDGSISVSELKSKMKSLDMDYNRNYYFAFYDMSVLEECPGSFLRNYVTLILQYCSFLQGKSVNFLSLRIKREDSNLTIAHSLIFDLELPVCQPSVSEFMKKDPQQGWVGWEKNERGKMGPRLSNMKSFLDPKELAESSVDLNLKLMKWRLLSNIDLDKIKMTNFLLLGSGTLGCSVARIILGWGARNISFVDNSNVSYSNPVRQSLFTFEDSKISKPKSLAAADSLRNIFPGVKSKSYQLTIPMPGHPVSESMADEVKKDVELLGNLIEEHDVIFLLMDSRESRWLPTVLGTYYNKIVINAALGFDSYLVMRHGIKVDVEEFKVRQHPPGFKSLKGNFLGCYFCNDVTAPGNSLKDRTLDQQCTVTRPGVSAIAGALAAELAISLLQHKEGAKAPAFFQIGNVLSPEKEISNQSVLGMLPHSIRGYLSTFSQVLPATERYKSCIACSDIIQEALSGNGFKFLMEVFRNSKCLEDITGLSTLTKQAEDIGIWELSDDEEIECTNYEAIGEDCPSSSLSMKQNKSGSDIDAEDFVDTDTRTVHSMTASKQALDEDNIDLGNLTICNEKDAPVINSESGKGSRKEVNELTRDEEIENNTCSQLKEISSCKFNTESLMERLISTTILDVASHTEFDTKDLPFTKLSSTDFLNCVLSTDVYTIFKQKNITSSVESLLIDLNKVDFSDGNLTEVQDLSNTKLVQLPSRKVTDAVLSSHDYFSANTSRTGVTSHDQVSATDELCPQLNSEVLLDDIPKELIPILEKQSSLKNSMLEFRKDEFKFKNAFKSFKLKVKSLIGSANLNENQKDTRNDNKKLHMSEISEEKINKFTNLNNIKSKILNATSKYLINAENKKESKINITTLKSKISFTSSDSVCEIKPVLNEDVNLEDKRSEFHDDKLSQVSDIIDYSSDSSTLVEFKKDEENKYKKSKSNAQKVVADTNNLEMYSFDYEKDKITSHSSSNILTLKANVKSFTSSLSEQSFTLFRRSSNSDIESSTDENKYKRELLLPTSEQFLSFDSLPVDEYVNEINNERMRKVITLAEPKDIFSSGSLTSESLCEENSVYFLASTESRKEIEK